MKRCNIGLSAMLFLAVLVWCGAANARDILPDAIAPYGIRLSAPEAEFLAAHPTATRLLERHGYTVFTLPAPHQNYAPDAKTLSFTPEAVRVVTHQTYGTLGIVMEARQHLAQNDREIMGFYTTLTRVLGQHLGEAQTSVVQYRPAELRAANETLTQCLYRSTRYIVGHADDAKGEVSYITPSPSCGGTLGCRIYTAWTTPNETPLVMASVVAFTPKQAKTIVTFQSVEALPAVEREKFGMVLGELLLPPVHTGKKPR